MLLLRSDDGQRARREAMTQFATAVFGCDRRPAPGDQRASGDGLTAATAEEGRSIAARGPPGRPGCPAGLGPGLAGYCGHNDVVGHCAARADPAPLEQLRLGDAAATTQRPAIS